MASSTHQRCVLWLLCLLACWATRGSCGPPPRPPPLAVEDLSGEDEQQEAQAQEQVAILKQINRVNDDGSYTFGYEAADGSFKIETRDVQGNVKGMFGFIDESGTLKRVSYSASNGTGFQTNDRASAAHPLTSRVVRPSLRQFGLRNALEPTPAPRPGVIQVIPRTRKQGSTTTTAPSTTVTPEPTSTSTESSTRRSLYHPALLVGRPTATTTPSAEGDAGRRDAVLDARRRQRLHDPAALFRQLAARQQAAQQRKVVFVTRRPSVEEEGEEDATQAADEDGEDENTQAEEAAAAIVHEKQQEAAAKERGRASPARGNALRRQLAPEQPLYYYVPAQPLFTRYRSEEADEAYVDPGTTTARPVPETPFRGLFTAGRPPPPGSASPAQLLQALAAYARDGSQQQQQQEPLPQQEPGYRLLPVPADPRDPAAVVGDPSQLEAQAQQLLLRLLMARRPRPRGPPYRPLPASPSLTPFQQALMQTLLGSELPPELLQELLRPQVPPYAPPPYAASPYGPYPGQPAGYPYQPQPPPGAYAPYPPPPPPPPTYAPAPPTTPPPPPPPPAPPARPAAYPPPPPPGYPPRPDLPPPGAAPGQPPAGTYPPPTAPPPTPPPPPYSPEVGVDPRAYPGYPSYSVIYDPERRILRYRPRYPPPPPLPPPIYARPYPYFVPGPYGDPQVLAPQPLPYDIPQIQHRTGGARSAVGTPRELMPDEYREALFLRMLAAVRAAQQQQQQAAVLSSSTTASPVYQVTESSESSTSSVSSTSSTTPSTSTTTVRPTYYRTPTPVRSVQILDPGTDPATEGSSKRSVDAATDTKGKREASQGAAAAGSDHKAGEEAIETAVDSAIETNSQKAVGSVTETTSEKAVENTTEAASEKAPVA
ncbi:uncharacterized protein LOC126455848 [Schistocerca serialis cubense]|uniref:uncharacterized protein LOC126455848 n=1 Tax=Schistocerca serialis cubense TaxID=2023355 RepID=UPI00214E12A5|nr:uncharacterized protein LOC126455848 [Schistocerca serialis cubense]